MTPERPQRETIVAYGEVLLRLKSPGFERLLQTLGLRFVSAGRR